MRFGYNGKIVGEKRMDDFFYNIATDGTNFFCNRSDINNKRPDQYEIAYLDGDFNISDNKLHMRENFKNTLFTRGNFLTSCQSIYYTRRLDNTIYQIKDTELIRKYNIDFAGHSLPESLLNYGVLEFSEACRENEYVYSITDVMESDHHLFFRTNIGLFVFNKTNQTLLGYKSIWTTKIKIGTGTYNPIGCSNNQIAVIINPMVLASIKETASKIPDFDNWEALKLAQEVDEEDNPILYIYELI
jgi:hypothetical protein